MTSNVAQQTLQLHALCITGLPPQVLASLIVTISARPPGADSYERIAVFSSLRVHTGSGHGASALHILPEWPRCRPLSVCSGEAVTEAAGQLCRLQGDVRFEVLKGLVKKPGKLRKVRLFCSSFSTAGMLQGGSTGAQQHLHEVHPAVGSTASIHALFGHDEELSPTSTLASLATWPAAQAGTAELLKQRLFRSGTEPSLYQLQFCVPGKGAPLASAPLASAATPPAFEQPPWPSQPPNPFGQDTPPAADDVISSDLCSSSRSSSPNSSREQRAARPLVSHLSAPHSRMHQPPMLPTPFAGPASGTSPGTGGQAGDDAPHVHRPHAGRSSARRGFVRQSRSMVDLTADQPRRKSMSAATPALLSIGSRTFSTPLESAVSLRCRVMRCGALTVPSSPANSSSSGELQCSAPNTPSYPRPEATFDWSFQADRDARLGDLEADELYLLEEYGRGQQHVVPPLLSDACATPMDGARLIKWMSSCWWMSLV